MSTNNQIAEKSLGIKPVRRELAVTCTAITHKFKIAEQHGYITVNLYDDGIPGELFVTMDNVGAFIQQLLDSFASAIGLLLQYGVPLTEIVKRFKGTHSPICGDTNNMEIPSANSIEDYIMCWLELKFIPKEKLTDAPVPPEVLLFATNCNCERIAVDPIGPTTDESLNPT